MGKHRIIVPAGNNIIRAKPDIISLFFQQNLWYDTSNSFRSVGRSMTINMDHIRRAAAEDLNRIAEIEIFNYRLYFYPIFRSDRYYFEEKTVPNLTAFYAAEPGIVEHTAVYDDGAVKGFVRVNGEEIEKLFVEPVLQNRGIGDALFRYAVDACGGKRLFVLEKEFARDPLL